MALRPDCSLACLGCDCRKLHLPGFYHAVMRYGYMDSVRHDEQFVEHIMQVCRWCPPAPCVKLRASEDYLNCC